MNPIACHVLVSLQAIMQFYLSKSYIDSLEKINQIGVHLCRRDNIQPVEMGQELIRIVKDLYETHLEVTASYRSAWD